MYHIHRRIRAAEATASRAVIPPLPPPGLPQGSHRGSQPVTAPRGSQPHHWVRCLNLIFFPFSDSLTEIRANLWYPYYDWIEKSLKRNTHNGYLLLRDKTDGQVFFLEFLIFLKGLLWRLSDEDSSCQCRRCGFDSWVGKIPWRRKWWLTPVLPGKFQGERSLVGYSPWGHRELDMT